MLALSCYWTALAQPHHTVPSPPRRASYPSDHSKEARSRPRGGLPNFSAPQSTRPTFLPKHCVHCAVLPLRVLDCKPLQACHSVSGAPGRKQWAPLWGAAMGSAEQRTVPHDPGWAPFSSLRTQHPTSPPGSTRTGIHTQLMSLICHISFRGSSALGLCPGIQTDTQEQCGGTAEFNKSGYVTWLLLITHVAEGKLLPVKLSFLIYKVGILATRPAGLL